MTTYRSQITVPDAVRAFMESVQGVGALSIDANTGFAVFTFEADDLYDAAMTIRDLQDEIRSNDYTGEIGKPVEIPNRAEDDDTALVQLLHPDYPTPIPAVNALYLEHAEKVREFFA